MNTEYKRLQQLKQGLFTSKIEVWKDIVGYEGCYQISSFGRVKSMARTRTGKNGAIVLLSEKIMSLKTNKGGYLCVGLHSSGKKFFTVHRLVAVAFLSNTENKSTVNHIDCNKKNNNISNLEWSTHQEQMSHAVENDLLEKRGKPKFTKKQKAQVLSFHTENPSVSITKLADIFGMSERTVGRIVRDGVKPRETTCKTNKGLVVKKVTSNQEVLEIKSLREQGKTLSEIGEIFNLGTSQVWRICKNLSRNNDYED